MLFHIIALALGCILDLLIGDPYGLPHPIRWIGSLISCLEGRLLDPSDSGPVQKRKGLVLCLCVMILPAALCAGALVLAYHLHPAAGVILEGILSAYLLAARSLQKESTKVQRALEQGQVEEARRALSMIVGRDVSVLDEAGIARAAVETVAENANDGVIAPLLYTALGGPVLGMLYKSINTMDSMLGYHNERYEHFGFFAAKIDDVAGFLPARISALLMIVSSAFLGPSYSAAGAWRIFIRDRFCHKSPNSAQTESACAGALGLRLAGDAVYFGQVVKKPYIGDAKREIESCDIARANRLMMAAGALTFFLAEGAWMALLLLQR